MDATPFTRSDRFTGDGGDSKKVEWPEPSFDFAETIDLDYPTYDTKWLGPLGDFVEQYARDSEAEALAPFVASSLLCSLSAALGTARLAAVRAGLFEEKNQLWFANVAPAAGGKTRSMLPAMAAFENILATDVVARKEQEIEINAKKRERDEAKKYYEHQFNTALKHGHDTAEIPVPPIIDEPIPSIKLIRSMHDGTFSDASFSQLLCDNPRGVFMTLDELSSFLAAIEEQKMRPQLLRLHGMAGVDDLRTTVASRHCDLASFHIAGNVVNDNRDRLMTTREGVNDGLWSRFLMVVPSGPLSGQQLSADYSTKKHDFSRLVAMADALRGLEPGQKVRKVPKSETDEDGTVRSVIVEESIPWPRPVPFLEGARKAVRALEIEMCNRAERESGMMQSLMRRIHGQAARLALAVAFVDWAWSETDNVPVTDPNMTADGPAEITRDHAERGVALARYHLAAARFVLFTNRPQSTVCHAVDFVRWLRKRDRMESITPRQIQRTGGISPGLRMNSEAVEKMLVLLSEHDIVARRPVNENVPAHKQKVEFMINPKVYDAEYD